MKVLKIIFNIVRITFYVLIGIVLLFVVVSLIAGWKLYGVKTPSMEPDYPVGSLVAVEKTDYDSLKVNDVITYNSGGQVVTHRIVKLLPDTKSVITRGDRNNMDDPSVNNENIIGRVKFSVPLAGYIVLFMNTRFGRIMTIIFILALIGGSIIFRMAKREDNDPQDEPKDSTGGKPKGEIQDEVEDNLENEPEGEIQDEAEDNLESEPEGEFRDEPEEEMKHERKENFSETESSDG